MACPGHGVAAEKLAYGAEQQCRSLWPTASRLSTPKSNRRTRAPGSLAALRDRAALCQRCSWKCLESRRCSVYSAVARRRRPEFCLALAAQGSTESPMADAARLLVDDFVRSSMAIGIGGGAGSLLALDHLASKTKSGALKDIVLLPSSALLASEIASYGIPMTTLEELKLKQRQLDLAFCDADIVQEGTLYGIIGRKSDGDGRGSLVKEKLIARAAKQFLVLVPASGFVEQLNGSVPVEIQQFDWLETAEEVDDIFVGDAEVWRRPSMGEAGPLGGDFPWVTEEGNFVLDVKFDVPLERPEDVANELSSVPGVKEHGILLNEVHLAAVAYPDGVKIRTSLFRTSFASS